MRFFLAFEPRDYVHKSWDPKVDSANPENNRLHLWQVYDPPPLDGVLVSRTKIKSPRIVEEIEEKGIHDFLRYQGPILGDCGAFTYIKDELPPFEPLEMLEYYDKSGFDLGTTIDHLIVPFVIDQKESRYKITLSNAEVMYKHWNTEYRNGWELVGIAQGWGYESYCEAVKKLVQTGFSYIGIGGIARRPTKFIKNLLERTKSMLKDLNEKPRIHVFGVGRKAVFDSFLENGVTSFDTTTILRQAWLRERDGYHLNDEGYASIRVPEQEPKSVKVLKTLRNYDANKVSIQQSMEVISEIEKRPGKEALLKLYHKTLEDRPWKRCDCKICRLYGIDTAIFRGNERNMRRGFHNVWQFYKALKEFKKAHEER